MIEQAKTGNSSSLEIGVVSYLCSMLGKTLSYPFERAYIMKLTRQEFSQQSAFKIIKYHYQSHGLLYLWIGNLNALKRYCPIQAINFTCFDYFKRSFVPGGREALNPKQYFSGVCLSGGLAGSVALLLVYPLNQVLVERVQMEREIQASNDKLKARLDSWRKRYKGFFLVNTGTFIYRACYFGIFDFGTQWKQGTSLKRLNVIDKFLIGFVGTWISFTLIHPLHLLRRQQVHYDKDKSAWRIAWQMYKKHDLDWFKREYRFEGWKYIGPTLIIVLYDEILLARRELAM